MNHRQSKSTRMTLLDRLALPAIAIACLFPTAPLTQAFEGRVNPDNVGDVEVYSPFVDRAYPDQVLFGDLHFHTEISFDAGLIGTSLTMHDAFRIARGERVLSNTGQPVQLVRPLDFLAITEHAEMIGLATAMRGSDPRLLADEWGARTHALFNSGQEGRMAAFADIIEYRHRGGS